MVQVTGMFDAGPVASLMEIRGRRNLRVIETHPIGGLHRHRRLRHEPDYRRQPADLLKMIQYKVEETGADYIEIPTRSVKLSQRCPVAQTVKKKR